jgi:hypothetical protein
MRSNDNWVLKGNGKTKVAASLVSKWIRLIGNCGSYT